MPAQFIPTCTSEAGLCLTAENWQNAGIKVLSCSLEALLYKPGYTLLKQIPNLNHYLGWAGELVLNASSLKLNKEGFFILKSPYDGSQIHLSVEELFDLVNHLKPRYLLLPKRLGETALNDLLLDDIYPFFAWEEVPAFFNKKHGVYFDKGAPQEKSQFPGLRYLIGEFDAQQIQALAEHAHFIESNQPVAEAMLGKVYNAEGVIDIMCQSKTFAFNVIDDSCQCSSCSQQLTQAYFHHLLEHTPLLCQRFLMGHNLFWVNKLLAEI